MTVLRWLVVLAFSVVADLANPALPGALEIVEETEEAVHLAGHRRPDRAAARDRRVTSREAEAVRARRAIAVRAVPRRPRPEGTGVLRKLPPRGAADASSAPDAH